MRNLFKLVCALGLFMGSFAFGQTSSDLAKDPDFSELVGKSLSYFDDFSHKFGDDISKREEMKEQLNGLITDYNNKVISDEELLQRSNGIFEGKINIIDMQREYSEIYNKLRVKYGELLNDKEFVSAATEEMLDSGNPVFGKVCKSCYVACAAVATSTWTTVNWGCAAISVASGGVGAIPCFGVSLIGGVGSIYLCAHQYLN